MRLFVIFLIALAGVGTAACGTRYAAPYAQAHPISPHYPPAFTRAAIHRALALRRYHLDEEGHGFIVASLDHRGRLHRVRIDYQPGSFEIGYLDSEGFETQIDVRSGDTHIDHRYNRYVRRLARTIESELERPERERRAALEAERRRQAEIARQQREAQSGGGGSDVFQQYVAPALGAAGAAAASQTPPAPAQTYQSSSVQSSSSSNLRCCLNGALFSCPSTDAMSSCIGGGASACRRVSSRDGEC